MIVLAVAFGFLPLSGLWTGLNLSVWVWAGPVFVPSSFTPSRDLLNQYRGWVCLRAQ